MARSFAVNWDYRCPFARNAHEHVVAGLRAGAEWDVPEGAIAVWDDPGKGRDLLAMEAALVVRDRFPERFLDVHAALFSARHDEGRDLRERDVVHGVLVEAGADADAVLREVDDGWPLETFRKAHESAAAEHDVWGVPTFTVGNRAAFVRLMTRPGSDDATSSIDLVERVVDAVGSWSEVNELKHTSLAR